MDIIEKIYKRSRILDVYVLDNDYQNTSHGIIETVNNIITANEKDVFLF